MSRPIRAHRVHAGIAALGLATATLAASGCAAGQLAETSEEASGVDGTHADLGAIALRNVVVAYPDGGAYRPGSSARLEFVAVNNSQRADQLVSVRSTVASGATVSDPSGSRTSGLRIGAQARVQAYDDGPNVMLVGVTQVLRSSQSVGVTLTFAHAGSITLQVPVGAPLNHVSQSES